MDRKSFVPTAENQKLLRSKFFWIALLYFSEGFPLGAFFDIFPVYFRNQGIELSKIGLLSLLGLAWTLKFLWAPAIDYFRHHRYWMVAADCIMGVVMLAFAVESGFGPWVWIAIGVFTVMSATNDIATDGYTIELLDKEELGLANGIRIGFYRVGMLTAGGVLIVSGYFGWTAAFFVAALISVVCAVISFAAPREAPAPASSHRVSLAAEFADIFAQPRWVFAIALLVIGLVWPVLVVVDIETLKQWQAIWWFKGGIPVAAILGAAVIATLAARRDSSKSIDGRLQQGPMFGALIDLLSRPGVLPVLVFILIFKLADSSMGFMIKPYWVDSGFTNERIGLISVNIGLLLSIAGGLAGGWYTDRVGIFKALWVLGLWQAFSNLGYVAAASVIPLQPQGAEILLVHQALMYSASAIESFTGGLGSAAFLAFLMAIVKKERSTTEYAILSSIFAFSRSIAGWAGGIGAQEMGYANYFLLTFFLAFPAYLLLGPVKRMLAFSEQTKPL